MRVATRAHRTLAQPDQRGGACPTPSPSTGGGELSDRLARVDESIPALQNMITNIGEPTSKAAREASRSLKRACKEAGEAAKAGHQIQEDYVNGTTGRLDQGGLGARAAAARIAFHQSWFDSSSNNALKALGEVSLYFAHSADRPGLKDVLWGGLPQMKQRQLPTSVVSTTGAYLFMCAAYLGALTADCGGEVLITTTWDPSKVAQFWASVAQDREARQRAFERSSVQGIGRYFLESEFPSLHGPAALGAFPSRDGMKELKRLADAKQSIGEASRLFSWWVAMGLGLGLKWPDEALSMVRLDAQPADPEKWEAMRAAGLDIPSRQTPLDLPQMADDLTNMSRELIARFYPESAAAVGW